MLKRFEENGSCSDLLYNLFYISDKPYTRFPELDPLLLKTLKTHFEAYYYGDKDAYAETLSSAEDSWMLDQVKRTGEIHHCAVSLISADYNIENGESYKMHVPVLVRYQTSEDSKPSYKLYYCGITKKDGKYYIYDYD